MVTILSVFWHVATADSGPAPGSIRPTVEHSVSITSGAFGFDRPDANISPVIWHQR
jgi:hypothetical protein